jgi:hypothetical protein
MRPYSLLIGEVMRRAVDPGAVTPPEALLAALAGLEKPVEALFDHDSANVIFEALHQEFSLFRRVAFGQSGTDPQEVGRCASLLRWLIQEYQQWRADAPDARVRFAALIVVSQACDGDNQLWQRFPKSVGENPALLEEVAKLVSSFAVQFTERPGNVPIWEREAVQALLDAEAAGDWAAIGERWRPFETAVWPNAVQVQTVRYLCRYDPDRLASALRNIRQTATSMLIAASLTVDQRLSLAAACANPSVQFACVYRALMERNLAQLDDYATAQLEAVLLSVANDAPRWEGWMRFFNGYPVRYPALQIALGRTLAAIPEAALQPYVNSMVLHAAAVTQLDPIRQAVALCLGEFRARAETERRLVLWRLAHARWEAWNFDEGNRGTHLFSVHRSPLDYALVGYAVECLDQTGRDSAVENTRRRLETVEDAWHPSISDIVTAWNRLLSHLQPYAHAAEVLSKSKAWLAETDMYIPFDPGTDRYLALRFRIH